jgi:two-component system, sensor histidine kinase ChiS
VVEPFFKSLFYSFESLAESQKIILKFESEYKNIPVVFDPDKMEKIFYNLISNAFNFVASEGEIEVCLNVIDSIVEIRIKDSGIGIPSDRLPHIFDRFYQVDGSATRKHEGTGIGLAVTKELIELHKGNISVNSKEGEGSEFIIRLPLGESAIEKDEFIKWQTETSLQVNGFKITETEEKIPELKSSGPDNNEIILIVEDNPDVRNYIRELLEKDYQVIEASDGEEGESIAKDEIPDLIITDVMMPEMDGFQFSKKIRNNEKTSHIPLVMLTAKAGFEDKIEGLESGIDAYMTKPFKAKELKVQVKNLLKQRELLRERFRKLTVIKPSEVSAISADQVFLQKTILKIENHFGDFQFSVEQLAEHLNMSISQLNRKLNALIGQPGGQLMRSLRLQRAADLLKQNSESISVICYNLGFNDHAYFSRAFKKQFGCSPSEYKNGN